MQIWQNIVQFSRTKYYCCLLFRAARRPVRAWKPDLILATEHLDPHVSHCRKNNLVSFCKIVSGDLHVWHVTYSLIYLRRTFSICFCWKRPLIMSWLLLSIEPLVPNSASKYASKCFGCLCKILQISPKFAKDVFFVPILNTWGGLMMNFRFSPATTSGFFAFIVSNTLVNSSSYVYSLSA